MPRKKLSSYAFFLVSAVFSILAHPANAQPTSSELRLVQVRDVMVDQRNRQPVVLLEEKKGSVLLPIWIGAAEAQAILMALKKVAPPRPMAHDLMRNIIGNLDVRILRVVITELRGGVYFAFIEMEGMGKKFFIDSRPSDAIALALKVKSPIYVKSIVMKSGIQMEREHTHRKKLGLALQRMTPSLARFFGGRGEDGLLVSQVREGTPASKAGLRRGDVIFKAEGKEIRTVDFFEDVFRSHPLGMSVAIRRGLNGKVWHLKLQAEE